ncbi:ketopantoate reductase family protein [Streptomyces radicis]|uniref:2-dehydropantoate 2-reductase n=1 Tax=Streptomyces radicis TaxID=1750517 RepID=A0A3A9WEF2_9ACTN|nr:2-dehydropantoate 2-reductase [Streptomyces radicis]RKN11418.1 2-dehydropantoate 2-reductase [Streptomyces radicis]RKN26563.1 2-dehydropantoate 2-reductase [Streptomyces radicis]
MRYIVIGAGAVGGAIGGRLHQSGRDVVLVARGAHAAALRAGGLRLTTPEGRVTLPVPVAESPEEVAPREGDVLILSVKTQDTQAALATWAEAAGDLPLFTAQNGVANEPMALRHFRRVHGVCVWLPSQFLEAGAVVAPCGPLTGILHLGRYPEGSVEGPVEGDETLRRVSEDLQDSHFGAPVVPDVMRWKYAKLLSNLGNALEALCGPVEGEARTSLFHRARDEGVAALNAAGIPFTSSEEQAAAREGRMTYHDIPGAERGSSTWQSLRRGRSVEADWLNGEVVLLGRRFGVPTPVNEALQRHATAAAHAGRPPGSLAPEELGV